MDRSLCRWFFLLSLTLLLPGWVCKGLAKKYPGTPTAVQVNDLIKELGD